MKYLLLFCSMVMFTWGCTPSVLKDEKPEPPKVYSLTYVPNLEGLPRLSRDDFNRIAAMMDLPLFWSEDKKNPGTLDPGELAVLGVGPKRKQYVQEGVFTNQFSHAYRRMLEFRRREAVARELDQGRPTLVQTDFSGASEQDKAIVRHITAAARIIEELYALQEGSLQACVREVCCLQVGCL